MTPITEPFRPRGRPRGFDDATALETAMQIFWARGYEQSSVELLCREMNMPRTSLYHLFGDKEGLFLATISHYAETRLRPVIDALGPNGTLGDDLEAFFRQVVALSSGNSATTGCLISSVLADAATTTTRLQEERDRRFDALEARIAARLEVDGWPRHSDCPAPVAASLAAAMARGIVLRARSGQGTDILLPVGAAAVTALMALREQTRDRDQTA